MIPLQVRPAAVLAVALCAACGGGGSVSRSSTAPPPPPPTITSVVVAPANASVETGRTQQFTATVQGTGNFSQAVQWSVNDVQGGNATVGTISAAGLYSAPSAVPNPAQVTVRATSVGDSSKSATGAVTITPTPTLSIAPQASEVVWGGQIQFTATVTGAPGVQVNWRATAGQVTAQGLYTAPDLADFDDTVTAELAGRAEISDNATVVLLPPPPVISALLPPLAGPGDQLVISGENLWAGSPSDMEVLFPGPLGTTLVMLTEEATSTQVITRVPLGTSSGDLRLRMRFGGRPVMTSNPLAFTRAPRLRVRAERLDVSSGESVQMYTALLGDDTPRPLTWSATLGTVSESGLFTAPAVSAEAFSRVSGCIAATDICDSLLLRLVPFRIEPRVPLVGLGESIQLEAISGGLPAVAEWSQLAGAGSLTAAGLYTAAMDPEEAGGIPVRASYLQHEEFFDVGVTGGFPGIVNRIRDYIDHNDFWGGQGTRPHSVAVHGSRAFVAASDLPRIVSPNPYVWIDVYDISDVTRPVWLHAVESAIVPGAFYTHEGLLIAAGGGAIALYNLSSGVPVLQALRFIPVFSSFSKFHAGVLYGIVAGGLQSSCEFLQAELRRYDTRGGTIEEDIHCLTLPADAQVDVVIGTGERVFLSLFLPGEPFPDFKIGTFDLSVEPPALLGLVEPSVRLGGIYDLHIHGELLLAGHALFDISTPLPQPRGSLPDRLYVQQARDHRVLGATTQAGLRVFDISDPDRPRLTHALFDSVAFASGVWAGDHVLSVAPENGFTVLDVSLPGGLVERNITPVSGFGSWTMDQVVDGNLLYAGVWALFDGFVEIFDVSSGIPVHRGRHHEPAQGVLALALQGQHLLAGGTEEFLVLDVSNPDAPFKVASLPIPTSTVASAGVVAFLGTLDSRLLTVNISQLSQPVVIGELALPDFPVRARLQGSLLFIAAGDAGLLVYNVANAAAPVLLAQVALPTPVLDVFLVGDLALLAADFLGLVTVDTSDPAAPQLLGALPLGQNPGSIDRFDPLIALAVTARDGIAYLGTLFSNNTVYGIDYRDPQRLRLVSRSSFGLFTEDTAISFGLHGDHMTIGGLLSTEALYTVDVSSPRSVIHSLPRPEALFFTPPDQNLQESLVKAPGATKSENLPAIWKKRRR